MTGSTTESLARSSWGFEQIYAVLVAAAHSSADLMGFLAVLLVIVCLCGAAYAAWLRNVIATVLLLVVAIVVAYLLL